MGGLAKYLKSTGALKTPDIIKAFEMVDRSKFVLNGAQALSELDQPLPIGQGQTISQPYTVALMLEMLEPKPGQKILDVGSGSGWTTALLAQIIGPKGKVYGVERIPELVKLGQHNLAKYNFYSASAEQSKDGLGLAEKAPFDRILVSAAAEQIPEELVEQLAVSGIMIVPVRSSLVKVVKDSRGKVSTESLDGFAFVPLIT